MNEIKPCPFCGRQADYWEDNQYSDRHVIECLSCGAHKRSEYGYDSVLKDWNRRFDVNGSEMIDTKVLRYRPTLTARVGYKGGGEYNDVRVWTGEAFDTSAEALVEANGMASEVQLIAGIQMTTEMPNAQPEQA